MASVRGCVIKNSTAQTNRTPSTATAISFDTNVYDTNSFHTGTDGKITISADVNGQYGIFTSCLSFANVGGAIYLQSTLRKSGSTGFIGAAGACRILANGNGQSANNMWLNFMSPPILLTTGDQYETYIFSNDTIDYQAESSFGLYVLDNANTTQRVLARVNGDKLTQNYSTPTNIAFDGTDVYDTDAVHDPASNNDSLIIPSAWNGKYGVVYGALVCTLITNDNSSSLAISKGGSLTYNGFAGNSGEQGATASWASQVQTQVIQFATGDTFKLLAYCQDTSITLLGSEVLRTTFGAWVYGDDLFSTSIPNRFLLINPAIQRAANF